MAIFRLALNPLLAWNAVERAEFALGLTTVIGISVIVMCLGWRSAKKEREKRVKMRAEVAARKLEQSVAVAPPVATSSKPTDTK